MGEAIPFVTFISVVPPNSMTAKVQLGFMFRTYFLEFTGHLEKMAVSIGQ